MGKLILYGRDTSPPTRTCILTLKALNLPFELKEINLLEKEHLSHEYVAKNPQHTIPTLEDDGHFIWDSHAICSYLVRRYGKNDALYPKDFLARAVVDQRLHFESGALFHGCLRNIVYFLLKKQERNVPQFKIDAIIEAYDFLEIFLKDRAYIAGDSMTIADFSIICTVTTLVAFASIDPARYPKLSSWIKLMEKLPYYQEANGIGVRKSIDFFKSISYQIVQ